MTPGTEVHLLRDVPTVWGVFSAGMVAEVITTLADGRVVVCLDDGFHPVTGRCHSRVLAACDVRRWEL